MNKKEVENILKDYSWMINSIKIMRESLEAAGEGLTSQYGVEASLPKPQGTNSDPIFREVARRSKRWERIHRYEEKVKFVQDRMHLIKDEREQEVLYWILEGKSMRWIGMHMGLSSTHVQRIRSSIVDKLVSNVSNGTKVKDGA